MANKQKTTYKTATDQTRNLARQSYETFVKAGATNKDGSPLSSWQELPEDQKNHWVAVAEHSLTNDEMLYRAEVARQNSLREQEQRQGTTPSGDPHRDALVSQNAERVNLTAVGIPATERNPEDAEADQPRRGTYIGQDPPLDGDVNAPDDRGTAGQPAPATPAPNVPRQPQQKPPKQQG